MSVIPESYLQLLHIVQTSMKQELTSLMTMLHGKGQPFHIVRATVQVLPKASTQLVSLVLFVNSSSADQECSLS